MLFFAALSGTIPLFICTPLDVQRWWDKDREEWVEAEGRNDGEVSEYLDADLREACMEGGRYWVAFFFGLAVFFFLVVGPIFAIFRIQRYNLAHASKYKRSRHEEELGACKNCLEAVFVGHPPPPAKTTAQTKQHDKEYEERLLREPFSVL